jgi:hypothetical protein
MAKTITEHANDIMSEIFTAKENAIAAAKKKIEEEKVLLERNNAVVEELYTAFFFNLMMDRDGFNLIKDEDGYEIHHGERAGAPLITAKPGKDASSILGKREMVDEGHVDSVAILLKSKELILSGKIQIREK